MSKQKSLPDEYSLGYSRRQFLGGALAVAASGPLLGASEGFAAEQPAAEQPSPPLDRKIKLGLVGCGGRGNWIGELFKKHGGYEIHAVADYFLPVADRCGENLGVDKGRRFSGLSGYRKVIESGVEAVALIVPACFFPEQCSAAVAAGLHVYMAKPVAVDVPGCFRVEAAGKLATQKRRVFLVDYQMPGDPVNIQVADRIRNGEIGKLAMVSTVGVSGGHIDPPKTANIESRLQKNIYDYDIAIGGGFLVGFDIHSIDAAIWVLGRRPVAAMGALRTARLDPHGDSHDASSIVFEYDDGLIHQHCGTALPNARTGEISCSIYGQAGYGVVDYMRKARFHRRGEKPMVAEVENLYEAGAVRNIATFYSDVVAERVENPTVARAVDGCLTCIMAREAAARRQRLTMEEIIKENKRIEVDLTGLQA